MTQSNNIFLEQREIDAIENLSHYQRVQLEIHGNILREQPRPFPFSEMVQDDNRLSSREESYIFSLENPKP